VPGCDCEGAYHRAGGVSVGVGDAPTRDETPSATCPLTEREGNKRPESGGKTLLRKRTNTKRRSAQAVRSCSARGVRAPCYRQLV